MQILRVEDNERIIRLILDEDAPPQSPSKPRRGDWMKGRSLLQPVSKAQSGMGDDRHDRPSHPSGIYSWRE